jgi:hypothetical protein
MKRVEWSWAKAHDGRLLNESADTLATNGVVNDPRTCPVTLVRSLGEDTDEETHESRDGEETPVVSEDDSVHPVGKTFVQKDGPNTMVQFLSEIEESQKSRKVTRNRSLGKTLRTQSLINLQFQRLN